MSGACLDESTVLAFLDGTLPGEARTEVEAHLAACSACTEIATWAAADLAGASRPSRAPGREGQPFVGQLAPGSRVGRYQILGAVGRGGMGEVYAAYHPDLDRRIALKVVYEAGAGSAERRARLLREARAIARLSHPNVVGVYDAGTVGDRVYIAMEFVDGDTLDEWLRAESRTWRQILDVFVAAGRGLAAAHAAELVHRDFKPQNVMIGKDGSVRVMDFGLARMMREEVGRGGEADAIGATADEELGNGRGKTVGKVTRTGALLGTPAYMAPEQWMGEPIDARADQFSFCVALHEALYGARPELAHLGSRDGQQPASPDASTRHRRVGSPVWLRGVVLRGLAAERDKRFESMDRLLAALTRGRTRTRRRVSVMGAALVLTFGTLGAWRLSHARRFDCKVPADRIAAAWAPGDPANGRRQSIRAALLAGAGSDATTIWDRLSSALDEYVGRWGAMYKDTCEATHVRGEQSEEVLDLRMRCLNENLDEVRALTDVLARGDPSTAVHALGAVGELTTVRRCADVRILRSAIPLPRDEVTLRAVQALQRSLKDAWALFEVGRFRDALGQAIALRPEVEATRYKPLLGELVEIIGSVQMEIADPAESEATLHEGLRIAEAAGDDVTAAKAAINLSYVVGYAQGRHEEGKRWSLLANAILDRAGPGHSQIRGWAIQSDAAVLFEERDLEGARVLLEKSLVLGMEALGPNHPNVASVLSNLGLVLAESGNPRKALEAHDRALEIATMHGGPMGRLFNNRAEVLSLLGRYAEAEKTFELSLQAPQSDRELAYPLTGMGEVDLATADPASALPLLERALLIRVKKEPDATLVAKTRFALTRALWETGGDRARALSLAQLARETYATHNRPDKLRDVDAWLATHTKRRPN